MPSLVLLIMFLSLLSPSCVALRTAVTMSSSAASSSTAPRIIPRAAVSVVVRWAPESSQSTTPQYVMVQRGKQPNKGMWSLPGGKIEAGEGTLTAAKRELFEETRLRDHLHWHNDGPFHCTDSIHTCSESGTVLFHYVISQCFCIYPVKLASAGFEAADGTSPPVIVPSDDAADAQWWNLERVQREFEDGRVTKGVIEVLKRSEQMYQSGILPVER